MDTERLREFRTIVEAGSFRNAAEELGIAPSVLSTRFRSFENSLGLNLIDRNAHLFELTSAGKILYRKSDELLRSYNGILTGMSNIHNTAFRSLKLQLCAQTMPMELGPFLDRYCREYPNLFLGLYDENTCRIYEGIRSGEIDIAFAVGRKDDFADFAGREVITEFPRLKVHVAEDHRLASKSEVWFRELSGETFILYPNMLESFTRDLHKSLLDQSGIDYTLYDESHSPYFYDLLVPVGKGISLWSWNLRSAPNTTLLTIRDPGYETYMYMLYNPGSSNPAVRNFTEGFLEFRKGRQ